MQLIKFMILMIFVCVLVFQFGPSDDCSSDYVELSEIQSDGSSSGGVVEAFRARYCGNVS